jgi:tetratricopeptide (TPR) repeat protein
MANPNVSTKSQFAQNGGRDPLALAKQRLFPSLRNRMLSDAAGALAENNTEIAESLVRTYLEKRPDDPDALNILAEIARRAKAFEDAEKLLERCVARSPGSAGFRFNYTVVLRHLHKYEQALVQTDELLRREPQNPLFRDQKALVLTRLGRHAEALTYRRGLAEEFPQLPNVWLQLGDAFRDAGFQTECIAAFHKALELDPLSTGVYAGLASLKVYRFTAAEIAQMEKTLAQPGLSAEPRADVHHALGKAHGDAKDYPKSFENYAKGNALRRISVDFDPDRLAMHRRACESFFTEAFFRKRTGWGCATSDPVFIVGLPRSGSTLVEQILCSHSAVEGLGELSDLDNTLVRPLLAIRDEISLEGVTNGNAVDKSGLVNAYVRVLDRLGDEDFRSMGEQYLKITSARRTTGRPFFTDKTLRNFFYVGLIHLILPHAKIIDARRHPLDCGWSCFKSQFHGSNFALRLSDIGNDYVNYVKLMAHFDRVLSGKVYRLIHENLVASPEEELRRLFDHLELPFEEQCLRFYENKRPVFTQSSEQVRQPLTKSGMGQWVPYEPWLGPLKTALGPVLEHYPRVPDQGSSNS